MLSSSARVARARENRVFVVLARYLDMAARERAPVRGS
jgi:hypothetical protein